MRIDGTAPRGIIMESAHAQRRRLIVYVAGLSEAPHAAKDLFDKLRHEPGYGPDEAVYWQFPEPVTRLSRGSLTARCRDLADRIDAYWTGPRRTEEIVLIGHSIGGVMLRYAFLQALRGLDGPQLAWADAVSRIVLLAAPNRGVDLDRAPWPFRMPAKVLVPLLQMFTVLEMLCGSPFITNLRIQWLREIADLGDKAPTVVQVRARNDWAVDSEDSRDLETLPTGVQKLMPNATHADIACTRRKVREDYTGQRYDILRWAITEDVESTNPSPLPEHEATIKSVVFALHGIRSGNGEWPNELERKLHELEPDVLVVTPSYGRLSAYDFALPFTRRRNLRWFADQYSYFLARHPGIPFHFVGHSNGTYLFGQSLEQIPALAFQNVFLAGSVLPREFDWVECADRGQIGSLVNVCASADKPVAWLCSALRGLGMRDVGVGGFTGFDSVPPGTLQVRYIKGGHGAALVAKRLPGVVGFVHDNEAPCEADHAAPGKFFELMSRFAPVATWLTGGALIGLGWLSVAMLGPLVGLGVIAGMLVTTYTALEVA
ncbi:esterase/lipase family protein [Nocardia sp. NPDC049526]|uniref:esterase/lipase family protein n=1 Tax=Nocardia sp. NPDC049526 TaxID=3364316 RepID=UPI0037975AB8